jgi:hypothetical protein
MWITSLSGEAVRWSISTAPNVTAGTGKSSVSVGSSVKSTVYSQDLAGQLLALSTEFFLPDAGEIGIRQQPNSAFPPVWMCLFGN